MIASIFHLPDADLRIRFTVTGGLVGIEPYRRKYGFYGGEEAGYQLTPAWQSAIGQASTIGNIL